MNGESTYRGEFKSFVVISWRLPPFVKFSNSAGGVIIHKLWILTAGHVVKKLSFMGKIRIKVGQNAIWTSRNNIQYYDIVKSIAHEKYKRKMGANDIGMLKTNSSIKMNDYIQPARLPPEGYLHEGMLMMIGWGKDSRSIFKSKANILQKAEVFILDNHSCQPFINEDKLNRQLESSQICTNTPGKATTACYGDSGAPLLRFIDGEEEVVGIMSWILIPCGRLEAPTISTRVSDFIYWIKQKTEKYS